MGRAGVVLVVVGVVGAGGWRQRQRMLGEGIPSWCPVLSASSGLSCFTFLWGYASLLLYFFSLLRVSLGNLPVGEGSGDFLPLSCVFLSLMPSSCCIGADVSVDVVFVGVRVSLLPFFSLGPQRLGLLCFSACVR